MSAKRIAILYYGDQETRRTTAKENRRLPKVFEAFKALGIGAEAIVYNDDVYDEIRLHLSQMDAVLTWVNPIEGGRDRSKLDALLRDLASDGVYVSAHPDVILKLGTKEVLVRTRDLGWGCDTHLYSSLEEMRRELPLRLAHGETRVLKQKRGQSGHGVWRVQRESEMKVRVRHAKSGCVEEVVTLDEFFGRCASYFAALDGHGCMIDQAWQPRVLEGMVRCYLVKGKVEGFGRQEVVALHPTLEPVQRHYHPPTMPEFHRLKRLVEEEWVPAAQQLLQVDTADLPVLWDCDFMFGPKDSSGLDTYVLCEINASCVSPFPDSAATPLAKAVMEQIS